MDDERLDSQVDRATNSEQLELPVKIDGKRRPRETDGRGGRIDAPRPGERTEARRDQGRTALPRREHDTRS